jgi:hypothetical protein
MEQSTSARCIIGVSKNSFSAPLFWLAGAFVVCHTLENTKFYHVSPSLSCLTATPNGSQVAVADNKHIILSKSTISCNGVVNALFYSSKGTWLVAVQDDAISIYNKLQKLIVSIPIDHVLAVDFDFKEEFMITITCETIQKWDVGAFRQDNALKKYQLLQTLRIDSVIQNQKFKSAVWSGSGSRSIHAITNTGILMVIKENLWVDRWVDVKSQDLNCILCWGDNVIVGGSYTRYENKARVIMAFYFRAPSDP